MRMYFLATIMSFDSNPIDRVTRQERDAVHQPSTCPQLLRRTFTMFRSASILASAFTGLVTFAGISCFVVAGSVVGFVNSAVAQVASPTTVRNWTADTNGVIHFMNPQTRNADLLAYLQAHPNEQFIVTYDTNDRCVAELIPVHPQLPTPTPVAQPPAPNVTVVSNQTFHQNLQLWITTISTANSMSNSSIGDIANKLRAEFNVSPQIATKIANEVKATGGNASVGSVFSQSQILGSGNSTVTANPQGFGGSVGNVTGANQTVIQNNPRQFPTLNNGSGIFGSQNQIFGGGASIFAPTAQVAAMATQVDGGSLQIQVGVNTQTGDYVVGFGRTFYHVKEGALAATFRSLTQSRIDGRITSQTYQEILIGTVAFSNSLRDQVTIIDGSRYNGDVRIVGSGYNTQAGVVIAAPSATATAVVGGTTPSGAGAVIRFSGGGCNTDKCGE
jgi:hypothetical protein